MFIIYNSTTNEIAGGSDQQSAVQVYATANSYTGDEWHIIEVTETETFNMERLRLYDWDSSTSTPTPNAIYENETRNERNHLLTEYFDAVRMNPVRWDALTSEKQQKWLDYRQALLDVPSSSDFPDNVTWPEIP